MWILLLHILYAMGLSIILPLYFIQTYYLSDSIIFFFDALLLVFATLDDAECFFKCM